ncbi:MAG: GNAT family N-acetyltransferase [Candidatus Thermoplasmatota archaeon]
MSRRIVANAVFIHKVFESGEGYTCYASPEMEAALAIGKGYPIVIFTGDWEGCEIPDAPFPEEGFWTPACPPSAWRLLVEQFELEEAWPCWGYLAPEGFGQGPWNTLERLEPADARMVAQHWPLGGEDKEEYLRRCISRYESACVREGGRLIAWAGCHFELDNVAEMGFAHTMEGERRRGHAEMVTRALVNRLHAKGKVAHCYMFKSNEASIRLVERLGFVRFGEAIWADLGPRKDSARAEPRPLQGA